jgi:hypothetical protein
MKEVCLKPRSSNILATSSILGYDGVHTSTVRANMMLAKIDFQEIEPGGRHIRDVCYYYTRDWREQFWIKRLYVTLGWLKRNF